MDCLNRRRAIVGGLLSVAALPTVAAQALGACQGSGGDTPPEGAGSLGLFDPDTEAFVSVPLPDPGSNIRQIHGRLGEVWGPASGVDELVVVRCQEGNARRGQRERPETGARTAVQSGGTGRLWRT